MERQSTHSATKPHRLQLTSAEFVKIAYRLKCLSITWHDLWWFLRLTGMETKLTLNLTFADVQHLQLPDEAHKIIITRRNLYPDDVFVFQSHSNRVKKKVQPVSHIAFNSAIRSVSPSVTRKKVSSKSARSVSSFTPIQMIAVHDDKH